MAEEYPGTAKELCALDHENPFQLLAATILSAQTTDENVNKATPALFARYPTPSDLAHADPEEVERLVHSTGFFRNKTRSLLGMAQALEERFDGEVPTALEDLVTIPGVGRKTGNVIRSVAFDAARPARRHPRRSPVAPVEAHERDRPGEGRARPRCDGGRPRSGARSRCA